MRFVLLLLFAWKMCNASPNIQLSNNHLYPGQSLKAYVFHKEPFKQAYMLFKKKKFLYTNIPNKKRMVFIGILDMLAFLGI